MSISLKKGQKISLAKEDGSKLSKVYVGLGWDAAKPEKKGLFGMLSAPHQSIDCDASAILLRNGRFVKDDDLVYFGSLKHKSGAVIHMGDNLTGDGDGDDERIMIDLDRVPAECDRIIIVVNIFSARARHQHFGMIKNAFIRIVDEITGQEMMKYNLTDDYTDQTAMIFGEIYRHNGEWKFSAIGNGTQDGNISELAARYK